MHNTLGEELQHAFVHVVVDEDEAALRLFDDAGGKHIGIEYLPIEEDAFSGGSCFYYLYAHLNGNSCLQYGRQHKTTAYLGTLIS